MATVRSARVLCPLIGRRGLSGQAARPYVAEVRLGVAPVLGGASGVDLAYFFEGTGESVEVSGVLMASLPQAEDHGRRTPLLGKVAQVSEEHTEAG